MGDYTVRFVHKISPRETDVAKTTIPDNAFADRNTLGAAMRKAGILLKGARLSSFRVEGAKVVCFPICPGMTTYWHAIILTKEVSE